MTEVTLQLPSAFRIALGFALVVLLLSAWSHWRRGVPLARAALLLSLRGCVLLTLSLLCGWPVRQTETTAVERRAVAVLVDRSESMALADTGPTRYAQAHDFAIRQLLPVLENEGLGARLYLFAEDGEAVSDPTGLDRQPDGHRTNIAGAVTRALGDAATPPLAVVALTDGAANQTEASVQALSAMTHLGVPFIAVGFGRDRGFPTLTLRQLDAPAETAPGASFALTARLEATAIDDTVNVELLLLRDGRLHQSQTISHRGARPFSQSFRLTETEEGEHHYEVRLVPAGARGLRILAATAQVAVRVAKQPELRVLYVQGALTWDYKFVATALRADPTIRITGLTRTGAQSIFRQNVESTGELLTGFPTTIEQLAPFRAVVLSSLRPGDLSAEQQELLARFCSELGGGLLVMGGAATFDSGWKGSRLEDLVPIVFSDDRAVGGIDQQFHLELTETALRHPVFRIGATEPATAPLSELPTFSHYGRVDDAKPGAEVWMRHPTDKGPAGRRVLMAVQRYGAGVTAALMVENFWRWRMAGDSDPAAFDRFWRQLLRHLGQAGVADVAIGLTDDRLEPETEVRFSLERRRRPADNEAGAKVFEARIEPVLSAQSPPSPVSHPGIQGGSQPISRSEPMLVRQIELSPGSPVELTFRPERPGLYRISVHGPGGALAATRTVEVKATDVELLETARDMEHLRQWAALTNGIALPAEECETGRQLIEGLRHKAEAAQRRLRESRPVGFGAWSLAALTALLVGEWLLRKTWGLR